MDSVMDSSFWVALNLDYDPHHEKAKNIIENEIHGKIIIPYCVVLEVATILQQKESKERADQFIDFVFNTDDVYPEEAHPTAEFFFYKNHDEHISFADSSIIWFVLRDNRENTQLITFDKKQEKLYERLKKEGCKV